MYHTREIADEIRWLDVWANEVSPSNTVGRDFHGSCEAIAAVIDF